MDANFDSPYSLEARNKVQNKAPLFLPFRITLYLCRFPFSFRAQAWNGIINGYVLQIWHFVSPIYVNKQGFDVPFWKKILGKKLIGMARSYWTPTAYYFQSIFVELELCFNFWCPLINQVVNQMILLWSWAKWWIRLMFWNHQKLFKGRNL